MLVREAQSLSCELKQVLAVMYIGRGLRSNRVTIFYGQLGEWRDCLCFDDVRSIIRAPVK